MSITTMENTISQMQNMKRKLTINQQNHDIISHNNAFDNVFFSTLKEINSLQDIAKNNTQAHFLGDHDIGLNDVMVSLQKASIALNFGVQMKNKMIAAYHEIMNMQI